jgi:hypothetical protein
MSLSVCNLNVVLKYKLREDYNVGSFLQLVKDNLIEYGNFQLFSVNLFGGNSISNSVGFLSWADKTRCEITGSVETDSENFTLIVKFTGSSNFSILLRPNGSSRLSLGGTKYGTCDVDNIQRLLLTERDFYIHIIENTLPITFTDKTDFYMLLFNGVYKICHELQNTEENTEKIRNMGIFPLVDAPDYSGSVRRKGTIKMYMKLSRKCGVVKMNKESFQLMGFTKVRDIRHALRWLNKLVKHLGG